MKRIFIDTNIIIDLLANRVPHSQFAAQLFNKAELGYIKLYASSQSIITTHYIIKKYIAEENLRTILSNILDYLQVIPIDIHILKRGLNSKHKDFEDGIQILAASSIDEIDCIVTRNLKDFKLSDIPVFSLDELINRLK